MIGSKRVTKEKSIEEIFHSLVGAFDKLNHLGKSMGRLKFAAGRDGFDRRSSEKSIYWP